MAKPRKTGRKARPWRAEIPDDKVPSGKRSESFRTYKEAQDWQVTELAAQADGSYVSPVDGQVLFRPRYDAWVKAAHHLRATTLDRETSAARSLVLPTFGEMALIDIDFEFVEAWVAELVEAGYAASTIKKAHQVLSKVLAHAVKARKLRANPAAGVSLPAVEVEVQRILTGDEITAVAGHLPRELDHLWFMLSVFGGTRAEESFALRAGRVDRIDPEITINETVVETAKGLVWGKPKTRDGKRTIDLPNFVWEPLVKRASELRSDDLIFTAPGGGVVRTHNFRSRVWQKACVEAELGRIVPCARLEGAETCPLCKPGSTTGSKRGHYVGPNIHDLRHTAVSMWIKLGSNPLQVKERAGHAKVAFTFDRYGHLFPREKDPTMDKLDALGRSLMGTAKVTHLRAV